MKNITNYLALGALALGVTGAAHAVPTLKLVTSDATITVSDAGGNDSNLAAGAVTYIGAVGANWTINVDTGITKPAMGSPSSPYMDLAFQNLSAGAGTITLYFSENDFTLLGGGLANIGGTTGGTVTYQTYWSATNTLFALDNLLTDQGPFGAGAFSGTQGGGSVTSGPYSLTQVITITHTGQANTTGDAELRVPDSGSTLALLGAALAAMGLISRRRKAA